jgi:hypothetical protein
MKKKRKRERAVQDGRLRTMWSKKRASMRAQKENWFGFFLGGGLGILFVVLAVPTLVGPSRDAYAIVATGVGAVTLVGAVLRCLAHMNAESASHGAAWKGVDMAGKTMGAVAAFQLLLLGLDQLGVI